jgi:hypothetical protein
LPNTPVPSRWGFGISGGNTADAVETRLVRLRALLRSRAAPTGAAH